MRLVAQRSFIARFCCRFVGSRILIRFKDSSAFVFGMKLGRWKINLISSGRNGSNKKGMASFSMRMIVKAENRGSGIDSERENN